MFDGLCYLDPMGCGVNPPVPECWDHRSCTELANRNIRLSLENECKSCKFRCVISFLYDSGKDELRDKIIENRTKRFFDSLSRNTQQIVEAIGKRANIILNVYGSLETIKCWNDCNSILKK